MNSTRPLASLALALSCASLFACSDDKPAPKADTGAKKPAEKAPADDDKGHLETMDHNFDSAISLIDAIVAGDVKIAKAYGAELAKLKAPKGTKGPWETQFAAISAQGRAITEAKDLDAIAQHAGTALVACAFCHTKLDAGPRVVTPDDKPQDLMQQHQWASDRLVDGLYDPDNANWVAGAKAMQEALLVPSKARKKMRGKKKKKQLKQALAIEKEVHGMPLLAAKDQSSRAKAYGQLIATCAGCHQALSVDLRPPAMPLND